MKLKHKLIPLASIGAVCATVTPLVTSCGTGSWVNVADKFVPTIAQYPEEGVSMNYAQVTKAYLDAITDNKEIFRQDYLWSMSNLIAAAEDLYRDGDLEDPSVWAEALQEDVNEYIDAVAAVNPLKAKALAEKIDKVERETKRVNFRYDKIKLTVTDVEKGVNLAGAPKEMFGDYIPLISFDIEFSIDYTRTVDSSQLQGTERYITKGTTHYVNIPFIPKINMSSRLFEFIAHCPEFDLVYPVMGQETYMTTWAFYDLNKDKPWSVDIDYSTEYQIKGTTPILGKVNVTQKTSNEYKFGAEEFWENVTFDEYDTQKTGDITLSEEIIDNFRRACEALNEDGRLSSYYLYPVGYIPGKW